jgi:hypothetical protein
MATGQRKYPVTVEKVRILDDDFVHAVVITSVDIRFKNS